jgi:hypothetical protein
VLPPKVLVKKPTPPEMSGVSCARPFPVAQKIAEALAMITDRAILKEINFDI